MVPQSVTSLKTITNIMEFRSRAKLFERGSFLERFRHRNKQKPKESINNGIMTIKTKDGQVKMVNSKGEIVKNDRGKTKPQRSHTQVGLGSCRYVSISYTNITYFRPLKISSSWKFWERVLLEKWFSVVRSLLITCMQLKFSRKKSLSKRMRLSTRWQKIGFSSQRDILSW